MRGYIHSLQSLGTVDGPGVRAVVFTEGCPLRCAYCHNPDTWECADAHLTEHTELAERIKKLYPYIKNGGVTFSGGEPCLQAEFCEALARELRDLGLHIAIDTCGEIYDESVERLLDAVDLVLLDVKMTTEEDYKRYTGGSLERVISFLSHLEERGKDTWIRHVVVPGINDSEEDIERLAGLISGYKCISKVELLPFKTLCREKYKSLGIRFPLENTEAMSKDRLAELQKHFDECYK
ncbi:MAG: pyruvate formate lyase-activating protein [Clostridia bacterium]|nr:pyruvate formate lyase-activating protein [Clostridia bacterium]